MPLRKQIDQESTSWHATNILKADKFSTRYTVFLQSEKLTTTLTYLVTSWVYLFLCFMKSFLGLP